MLNKTCSSLFAILIGLILLSCSTFLPHKKITGKTNQKYNEDVLRSDFEYLFKTFENIHPNLYRFISKSSLDTMIFSTKERLNHPMTALEFWKTVSPTIAKLNDGHSRLRFPYSFRKKYLDNGGRIIPFNVQINENRLFVSANLSFDSTLAINSEILSINQIPSQEIIYDLRNYKGAERLVVVDNYIQSMFKPYTWMHYGFENNFKIEYISSLDNQSYIKTFRGITRNELDSLNAKQNQLSQKNTHWQFQSLPGDKIGIIDLNSFSDRKGFNKFLKTTFEQIQKESLKHLIIDIRNNGGGDHSTAEVLIDHLATKPWVLISKAEVIMNEQMRKGIPWFVRWFPLEFGIKIWGRFNKYTNVSAVEKVTNANGIDIYTIYTKPHNQRKNPLRFKGDVYVLINSGSYSMSVMFASIIKDYQFGTLIGEETGQPANPYGAVFSFELPNTKLAATVSAGRSYRPSGEITERGVIPDFEVRQNPEDLEKGIDTVMEFTKNLIRKNVRDERKAS